MKRILTTQIMKMNTADEIQNSNLESISQLTKSIEQLSLEANN